MPKRSSEVLPSCKKICVYRKKHGLYKVWYYPVLGIHWGFWGIFLTDKRGSLNRKKQGDVILQKIFREKKTPYTWLIKFQEKNNERCGNKYKLELDPGRP